MNNPSAAFVQSALSTIVSPVERLAFVASLKTKEVEDALRSEHLAIFRDWLSLTLEQQTLELEGYIATHGTEPRGLLRLWISEKRYGPLVPPDATAAERDLFMTDMDTALTALLARMSET